jgi:hypothetical protein
MNTDDPPIEWWAEQWRCSIEDATALRRDHWICTGLTLPRKVVNANGTWLFPPTPRRCSMTGSEMRVVDGRTVCPEHARQIEEAHAMAAITISELADHRLEREAMTGQDYSDAGLAILGGCEKCGAGLAAYNAYPTRSGYWRCGDCVGDRGFDTVEAANEALFENPDQDVKASVAAIEGAVDPEHWDRLAMPDPVRLPGEPG